MANLIKDTIKNLIANNDTKQAVELLLKLTKGSEKENEVHLQSSRLITIRNLIDSGVLDYTKAGEEINKIILALLRLTDSIELNNAVFLLPQEESQIQKKFSEELRNTANSFNNAWIVVLAFSFIGFLLMIFSNIKHENSFAQPAFWIGSILLLLSFIFFGFIQQKGTKKLSKSIHSNQELIDELQRMSITLSKFTRRITFYAATNSNNVNELLKATTPILEKMGISNEKVEKAFKNPEGVVSRIVEYSEEIEETIKEIEIALINGDAKTLKIHSENISNLVSKIKLIEATKTIENNGSLPTALD